VSFYLYGVCTNREAYPGEDVFEVLVAVNSLSGSRRFDPFDPYNYSK